jgi:hypothetical protein
MTHDWPELPPSWMRRLARGGGEESGHSTQVEHRLTWLEMESDMSRGASRKTDARITRLERMGILLLTGMHALAHDKLPEWAKSVSGLLKLMLTG